MIPLPNSIIVTNNTVETLLAGYDEQRFYLLVATKQDDEKQTIILNKREAAKVYSKLSDFIKED